MFRHLSILRRIGRTENFPASVLQQTERYQLGKPLVLYKPHAIIVGFMFCIITFLSPLILFTLFTQSYSQDLATYNHDLPICTRIIQDEQKDIIPYNTMIIPSHTQKFVKDAVMWQNDRQKSPYDAVKADKDWYEMQYDNIALQNDNDLVGYYQSVINGCHNRLDADLHQMNVDEASRLRVAINAILPAITLFIVLWRLQRGVTVCEGGLLHMGLLKESVVYWDEMQEYYLKRIILKKDSREFNMAYVMMSKAEREDCYRRVGEATTRLLLPEALALYEQRRPVAFGPLRIDPAGIATRGRLLPWDALRNIHVEKGNLSISYDGVWLKGKARANNVALLSTTDIPNVYTIVALVEYIVQQRCNDL